MAESQASSRERVVDALKQLVLAIRKAAESGILDGSVHSDEELYFRWKVDKFRYTDKGIADLSAHGNYLPKPSWFRGTIKLWESVKGSNEYLSTFELLSNVFGGTERIPQGLERFAHQLISRCLSESKLEAGGVESIVAAFLKDLREEPVKYGAEVELQGIVLQPDKVVPAFGVTLRQTRVEDLEKEFPAYSIMTKQFLPNPSAILNIEFLGRAANEIQREVEQAVVMLRLFKVGSIKWESYRMYSDSFTDLMASGTLTSGRTGAAYETYLLTEANVPRLKRFWQIMTNSLPKGLLAPTTGAVDHITIAYGHYGSALLENGSLESRVANSVMGLEALLLKPGEVQELIYRLSLRLTRLLGVLGVDPYEVKKVASDAYRVRNVFAHGGGLTYREKRKLDSVYGSVQNLLLAILDYLRILLVVTILQNKGKEEFIDLIEDSLIDRKKEEQLVSAVSLAKELLEERPGKVTK